MQWLRLLLPSRTKFKIGDERQTYIVDRPEPLLHFALCSGSHSDPAVTFELTALVLHFSCFSVVLFHTYLNIVLGSCLYT